MWYSTGPLIKHKLSVPGHSTLRIFHGDEKKFGYNKRLPRPDGIVKEDPLVLEPKTPEGFLRELKRRYGSVLRAIRSVYDIKNGSLTFREFCYAYKKLGFNREVRSVWFLLDRDLSGEVSLSELDPVAYRLLENFYNGMVAKYGSLASAWRNCLDQQGREVVPFRAFAAACMKHLNYTYEEAELLFSCLDLDSLGTVSYDEVHFLDEWNEAKTRGALRKARYVNRDPNGVVDWSQRDEAALFGLERSDAKSTMGSRAPNACNASLPRLSSKQKPAGAKIVYGDTTSSLKSTVRRTPGQRKAVGASFGTASVGNLPTVIQM